MKHNRSTPSLIDPDENMISGDASREREAAQLCAQRNRRPKDGIRIIGKLADVDHAVMVAAPV